MAELDQQAWDWVCPDVFASDRFCSHLSPYGGPLLADTFY